VRVRGDKLETKMQKAILLAENIQDFIKFVRKNDDNNIFRADKDKIYQIKLLVKEFRFQILADELLRINQFDWDAKYTHYLVNSFVKGLGIIEEYVMRNYEDLFFFSARIHTLKNLSQEFSSQD
jgi:hypothetical protein